MFNKVADWIYKFKVWISNKNPSNKYLRIVYYFLTGMILFVAVAVWYSVAIKKAMKAFWGK